MDNYDIKAREVFHALMHRISLLDTACKYDDIGDIVRAMVNWSYSHRCGNGMFSDEEQQEIIDKAFKKLVELSRLKYDT